MGTSFIHDGILRGPILCRYLLLLWVTVNFLLPSTISFLNMLLLFHLGGGLHNLYLSIYFNFSLGFFFHDHKDRDSHCSCHMVEITSEVLSCSKTSSGCWEGQPVPGEQKHSPFGFPHLPKDPKSLTFQKALLNWSSGTHMEGEQPSD